MKSLPQQILHFFVFSNLFIACCAVIMVLQTYWLLPGTPPDLYFIAFVFFSTLASYSFHWYLTPADFPKHSIRLQWLHQHRNIHLALLILGIAGAAFFSLFLLNHWFWLLAAALITFLYSAPKIPHPWFRALRKIALGKTIFLAFVWMYITTLLPLQMNEQAWKFSYYIFAASRFFFIYAICIIFDYRDREYDRSIGIKSLITWMNEKGIKRLFDISLTFFFILTVLLYFFDFNLINIVTLIIPGIIVSILYPYAIKQTSDLLYYLLLDGLMALSAVMTFLQNL